MGAARREGAGQEQVRIVMEQWESNREIDQAAATWLARSDRGLSISDQIAFVEWLNASPLHRGAYAKAEAIFALVDEKASDKAVASAEVPAVAVPPAYVFPPNQSVPVSRRNALWFVGGGLAATAIFKMSTLPALRVETYQTGRGEVRAVPLADGSVITLNTASKVSVRFRETTRELQLLEGEALFDVAKDEKRSFVVTAGNTVVRAVGTSFLVRNLKDAPLEVLVREGVVDMFRTQSDDARLRMGANSKAVALDVPYPSLKLVTTRLGADAMGRELAWRSGMISFEDETLKSAAVKFSRYSDLRIVIDDPEIANETVTGLFSIYSPQVFAESVAISLDLKISVTPEGVMLWR
jgi:transmembrane sensor